jgi:hypothetical protein
MYLFLGPQPAGQGTLHGEPPFYRAKDCPLHGGTPTNDKE